MLVLLTRTLEQLVVGKAEGRQGSEMLEFLLVASLPGGMEGAEHLSEQLGVFGVFLEIAAENNSGLLRRLWKTPTAAE